MLVVKESLKITRLNLLLILSVFIVYVFWRGSATYQIRY